MCMAAAITQCVHVCFFIMNYYYCNFARLNFHDFTALGNSRALNFCDLCIEEFLSFPTVGPSEPSSRLVSPFATYERHLVNHFSKVGLKNTCAP